MLPKLLDFVFPRICVGCGDWGFDLCPDCFNKIKVYRKKNIFPKPFNGVTAIFEYSGIIEKIIKEIKFQFFYDKYAELIELALACLGEDKDFTQNFDSKMILVPVPLHPVRLRWRGFNQSELLGKCLAKKLRIKIAPRLLQRIKNTQAQSLLKKEDRQENIEGAFIINPNFPRSIIHNSCFILFDDIWTTGATMIECAKVLKKNNAKFIWGITLAG